MTLSVAPARAFRSMRQIGYRPAATEVAVAPIRVVIADDDVRTRAALGALVEAQRGLELVGVATDATEAIEMAAERRPGVCIVDVCMPGGGVLATRQIRERSPGTHVLALSGRQDRATVVDMLRAGAAGYIVKGNEVYEIIDAIHAAARGEGTLSRQVADGVVGELSDKLAAEDAVVMSLQEQRARVEDVLGRGLLTMVFQPIVDLRDRSVAGYEALARIASEPLRPPNEWFAEAAQVGHLLTLELAAVRSALEWRHHLPQEAFLAINVSPAAAASDALLTLLPHPGGRGVVLEITEHAPIEDYETFVGRLDRLRRGGVRVAIDDAGAGFASLRHILRLAPDIIKTDVTLTRHIETDRAERALARALISFAAETEATLVAEGIETEAELQALRELGVRFGQGYHLGRPAALTIQALPARPRRVGTT